MSTLGHALVLVKTDSASGPELVSREENVSELASDILCPPRYKESLQGLC